MAMEVEETKECDVKSVMAGGCAQASVQVNLHPLVIMNVSDHWTRIRAQNGEAHQVIGALIGKQEGRTMEIMNSFELVHETVDSGDIIIDTTYYEKQQQLFKQVFQELEFLGWYTNGGPPNSSDISVHRQFLAFNDSPVFLKLDPYNTAQLPISMFESVIDVVGKDPTMLFVELQYMLVTEEAERIGLDNMAKVSQASDSQDCSLASHHLRTQYSAIKMLHSRVRLILEYMRAVQLGTLPPNRGILRDVFAMCKQLPVVNSAEFREEYYTQCNDVALLTFLGTLTKCCDTINQYISRFNVLHDRQGTGRRAARMNF